MTESQSETHHQINMRNEDFTHLSKLRKHMEASENGASYYFGALIANLAKAELDKRIKENR